MLRLLPRTTPQSFAGLHPRVILVALALALLSTTACQYDRESRLAEIRALQAAGQFDESIAPLRVFLTADANHPEANYRLGVALVQTGRPSLAVWPLQKAAESSDFEVQAGLLLASTLLSTESYEEAIRAADQVLSIEPDSVAALHTRTRANIAAGQPDTALVDANRILELNPDDFMGSTLKVAALIDLDQLDEAEQVQVALVEATREAGQEDTAARACSMLARFYGSQDQVDKARERIVDCRERHPDHAMVQQYASDFYRWVNEPDKAAQVWRDAIEASPEDISLRAKLGTVLHQSGMVEEAEATYLETAELFDTTRAWQILAVFYRETDRNTKAREAIETALAKSGKEPPALRFALADMLIAEGDYDRAEEIAQSMQEPSYRSLIRGSIKLGQNDPAGALKLLETGLRLWPNNAGARYMAGHAALTLGDLPRALAEYREATRIDAAATDAALSMARIYFSLEKYPTAMQFADRHIASRPFVNEDPYVIAIRSAVEQGLWAKAETAISNLRTQPGMRSAAVVEAAGLFRKRDGTEAAIDLVKESEIDLTDAANVGSLTAISFDLIELGRTGEALKLVGAALAKHPDDPALLDLKARQLARLGRDAEALAATDKALAADPEFGPALEVRAIYADQAGKLEEPLGLWERAVAADEGNAEYLYRKASALVRLGRRDEAIEELRKVMTVSPGHLAAVNDLAWHLADTNEQLDQALELARRAVQLDRQAETLDTLGFVHLTRGEAVEAISAFEDSLAARPESASVRYRLAMAQSKTGDSTAARENLTKALEVESFPELQAARDELARLESN